MVHFFKEVWQSIIETEKDHRNALLIHDGLCTNLSFFDNKTNPGFFTPFTANMSTQSCDESSYPVKAEFKQAITAALFLPAQQLQTALLQTCYIPAQIILALAMLVTADGEKASNHSKLALAATIHAAYFYGAFALTLIREVFALLTRSIASLIDAMHAKPEEGPNFPKYPINGL